MTALSDLSDRALAELEAKLTSDLAMVQQLRALVKQYQVTPATAPAAVTTVAMAAAPVPSAPAPVLPPQKSGEEVFLEAVQAMPESGFRLGNLNSFYASAGVWPASQTVKTLVRKMCSRGEMMVLETKTGRGGSLYRYVKR